MKLSEEHRKGLIQNQILDLLKQTSELSKSLDRRALAELQEFLTQEDKNNLESILQNTLWYQVEPILSYIRRKPLVVASGAIAVMSLGSDTVSIVQTLWSLAQVTSTLFFGV